MTTTFNLHDCPFCKTNLIKSTVNCPGYKKYPCLECPKCHSYFYTKNNYKILYNLAEKENRKLSSKVHYYDTETSIWNKKSVPDSNNKKTTNNLNTKSKKNKLKSKNKNQIIIKNLYKKSDKSKTLINFNVVKNCLYFKNKICTYFNDTCNPYSIRCKNPDILLDKDKHTSQVANNQSNVKDKIKEGTSEKTQYVKAVVLSHNKKCVYKEHTFVNIKAMIKVLTTGNRVEDIIIPAVHCKECNQYIILKSDFKSIKQKGTLLCRVIDETPEYIAKHQKSSYSGTESKVHRLGYNVIKQGYNYTFAQRKIILANILENYGITQHEILSMLDINIARKINLPNYIDAVEKWKQDREFVANYEFGSVPEVLIDEVVIGKRK